MGIPQGSPSEADVVIYIYVYILHMFGLVIWHIYGTPTMKVDHVDWNIMSSHIYVKWLKVKSI